MLDGEEIIYAGSTRIAKLSDEERKTDLFITPVAPETVAIKLTPGNFVVFFPYESHQALCASKHANEIRKAVFKIPRTLLED